MLLTSCLQQELVVDLPTNSQGKSHTIPMDSALSRLENFMQEFDGKGTRSEGRRVVHSIEAVTLKPQYTRAAGIDCDTIFYIANFANNQGYAILAADNRIPEPVLAVTDGGHMESNAFCTSSQALTTPQPLFPGYPSTGPGFYTLPETGDELYMNPNTANLYIKAENDTLVGNFEAGGNTRCIKSIRALPVSPGTSGTGLPGSLIFNYATDKIKHPNKDLTSSLIDHDEKGGGDIAPILKPFANWYQDTVLNLYYPKRHLFDLSKHKRAHVGCFPLSIAKLMLHYQRPANGIVDNYVMNWDEMRRNRFSEVGKISAAHLLYGISKECHSWYFCEGTFTLPWKAREYMKIIGFTQAKINSYSFEKIYEMLCVGKPIIIYSIPTSGITESHCWNIDGFTKCLKNVGSSLKSYQMLHCDFGWKDGAYNGYYVEGIFKLNNPENDYDNNNHSDNSTYYKNYIRIITY